MPQADSAIPLIFFLINLRNPPNGKPLGNLRLIYWSLEEYETAVNHLEQNPPVFEEINSPTAKTIQQMLDAIEKEVNGG